MTAHRTPIHWDARKQRLSTFVDETKAALAWVFRILMGWSVAVAAERIYGAVVLGFEPARTPLQLAVYFLLFLPTFFRFYYGDIRYFDRRTNRLKRLIAESDAPAGVLARVDRVLSSKRQLLDLTHAVMTGSLFVCLARAIEEPNVFVLLFYFLLLMNCVWLQASIVLNRITVRQVTRELRDGHIIREIQEEQPREDRVPRLWLRNNFGFCVVTALIVGLGLVQQWWTLSLSSPRLVVVVVVLGLANSIADIRLTYRHYFPQLEYVLGRPDEDPSDENEGTRGLVGLS